MTVNEIEARTGLDRGTVRYYEAEGLIRPAREPNGYRNYSEADLEKLQKVKLLRTLGFSLDDIRAMDAGDGDFQDRLRARIRSLDARAEDIEDARRVIQQMLADGAAYESLRSDDYLTQLESGAPALPEAAPEKLKPEEEPEPCPDYAGPWPRFFARTIDAALVRLCFLWVQVELLRVPAAGSIGERAVLWAVTLAAALALEPLFLRLFGATPGKLLLGLRVRGRDGRKLALPAAFRRTWGVLLWGEGLRLPLISLWRYAKSWRDAGDGLELPWEGGSEVVFTPRGRWWKPLCAVSLAALIFLAGAVYVDSYLPVHRGELTPEELAENVNWYLRRNLGEGRWELGADGAWTDTRPVSPGTVYMGPWENLVPAPVELTVENGVVTGLSWHQVSEDSERNAEMFNARYARALAVSLAGADRSLTLLGFLGLESKMAVAGTEAVVTACGSWRVWSIPVLRRADELLPDDLYRLELELSRIP